MKIKIRDFHRISWHLRVEQELKLCADQIFLNKLEEKV